MPPVYEYTFRFDADDPLSVLVDELQRMRNKIEMQAKQLTAQAEEISRLEACVAEAEERRDQAEQELFLDDRTELAKMRVLLEDAQHNADRQRFMHQNAEERVAIYEKEADRLRKVADIRERLILDRNGLLSFARDMLYDYSANLLAGTVEAKSASALIDKITAKVQEDVE